MHDNETKTALDIVLDTIDEQKDSISDEIRRIDGPSKYSDNFVLRLQHSIGAEYLSLRSKVLDCNEKVRVKDFSDYLVDTYGPITAAAVMILTITGSRNGWGYICTNPDDAVELLNNDSGQISFIWGNLTYLDSIER